MSRKQRISQHWQEMLLLTSYRSLFFTQEKQPPSKSCQNVGKFLDFLRNNREDWSVSVSRLFCLPSKFCDTLFYFLSLSRSQKRKSFENSIPSPERVFQLLFISVSFLFLWFLQHQFPVSFRSCLRSLYHFPWKEFSSQKWDKKEIV